MKNTLDFLNNYLKSGNKIVVAVSGGPDSMALLDILIKFKDSKKLTLICAHINHNKREASAFEAQMVEDYCLKNGVIFEYKKSCLNYRKRHHRVVSPPREQCRGSAH